MPSVTDHRAEALPAEAEEVGGRSPHGGNPSIILPLYISYEAVVSIKVYTEDTLSALVSCFEEVVSHQGDLIKQMSRESVVIFPIKPSLELLITPADPGRSGVYINIYRLFSLIFCLNYAHSNSSLNLLNNITVLDITIARDVTEVIPAVITVHGHSRYI